jgi:hypothetical protein
MAYCTLADLRIYVNKETDDTADDTLLEDYADRATAIVGRMTGRTFAADADSTQRFDAVRDVEGRLLLVRQDLCSITSVVNGDGNTVPSTAYVTEPRRGTPYYGIRLLGSAGYTWTYTTDPEDAIAVTGKWGYSTTPPDDVVQATVRLAIYLFRQRDNLGELDRTQVVGANVTVLPASLPRDVRQMLAPYIKRM